MLILRGVIFLIFDRRHESLGFCPICFDFHFEGLDSSSSSKNIHCHFFRHQDLVKSFVWLPIFWANMCFDRAAWTSQFFVSAHQRCPCHFWLVYAAIPHGAFSSGINKNKFANPKFQAFVEVCLPYKNTPVFLIPQKTHAAGSGWSTSTLQYPSG